MATLGRLDWYDIARSTNWTPTYVSEDELFPPELSGAVGLGMDAWERTTSRTSRRSPST